MKFASQRAAFVPAAGMSCVSGSGVLAFGAVYCEILGCVAR
jgi:hypothetical protein